MGNCASKAPSMSSPAMLSRPSFARCSSSALARIVSDEVLSTTAIGEWVNALLNVAVKRGVDFDQVDVARQVLHRVLRLLDLRGIDDAFPVLVRPAGGADIDA